MKKYVLTALTAAVCLTVSSVGYGAVFSDIGSSMKWAESYINSVYESGLMVGDYNSRGARVFRGSENITYSEAAQLVYSMTVKSGFATDVTDLGINRYSMEMANEGIDDWAEKAVAFCMEKGIVSSYDLTKFKDNGQDVKISREDMAVMFGKALALSYSLSTGTSLAFNDTWNISASAKPYVELLNKLGIVSGDNNNFNPKANITRAETAVLASKTFDIMKQKIVTNPESGYTQTSGTVVSVYESNGTYVLRLTTADGVAGFVLTDATPVYNNASSNVGPSGLGLGDSVTVYSSGANIAKVNITKDIVTTPGNVNMPQYTSTIKDKGELISAGEYKIGLIDKRGDRVYYTVARDAKITLDGKTATLRQLSDRVKGDSYVEVTVELNSSTQEANVVTAVEQKYTSDTEGKIKNMNTRQITIESGSKTFTYDFIKDFESVSIKYNGSTWSGEFKEDFIDDVFDKLTGSKYIDVELTLNSSKEVTKIVAKSSTYDPDAKDKEYSGTITKIDGSDIKVGSKTYGLSSSVRVDVVVGDDSIDDIDDLENYVNNGDIEIKADVTVKNNQVTRIEGYVSEIEGDLTFMTVSNDRYPRGKMGVEVSGKGRIYFNFDEDTRISVDGTDYDDININSLKNLVNKGSGISNVTVKFDDDGLATSVKD